MYEQGGEGKDKGERYIIIDAETGEILKDYRRKIRRTAVEYD
nr:hypothetical protein [Flavivirga aquatica]